MNKSPFRFSKNDALNNLAHEEHHEHERFTGLVIELLVDIRDTLNGFKQLQSTKEAKKKK